MPDPLVSIILATRNRAHLIGRALQSVLDQTFQDWELIIIDDASQDKTEGTVKAWQAKDQRIFYFKNEIQSGIAKSSNKGLNIAKGKYIAIIDDDDYWATSEKLEKQVEFLEKNTDYVGVGGGLIIIDKDRKEISRVFKPETDEIIHRKALFANPMANSTTAFRKDAAEKIGFYDESFKVAPDWDFWLKLGLQGKLYNFQDYFTFYLMSEGNISFVRQKENFKSGIRIVKRYKHNYPGFKKAVVFTYIQYFYTFLPVFVRRNLNPLLSRFKKFAFSS